MGIPFEYIPPKSRAVMSARVLNSHYNIEFWACVRNSTIYIILRSVSSVELFNGLYIVMKYA
jgi:hypothetical protein